MSTHFLNTSSFHVNIRDSFLNSSSDCFFLTYACAKCSIRITKLRRTFKCWVLICSKDNVSITHVHVISLDFSKAFDTARHSSLASKLATLPLPNCIYNWLLNFLSHRQHCTKFGKLISELASINASFVQGSVTDPTSFVINISDLKAIILSNILLKYADDIDLVIPPTNADTIDTELRGITAWTLQNNLVLNYAKSHHIVVRRPRFPRDHMSIGGVSSINRVYEMKVLGITFSDTLSLSPHVKYLSANRHKLHLRSVLCMLMVCLGGPYGQWLKPTSSRGSHMPVPCGGVFGERDQLAVVVTRLAKKNYLPPDQPTLHEMVATADVRLFNQVVSNPAHVLAPLIPPSKSHSYNLRKRWHDLQIPSYQTNILDENFITRTILELNHTWTELCRLTLTLTIVNFQLYCFFFVLFVRLSRHK